MKKLNSIWTTLGVTAAAVLMSASASASLTYSYSTDNTNFTSVTAYSGTQSATQYYNFSSATASGAPLFGTESNSAFFWLWQETDTNKLSLNVIFDTQNDGSGGSASFLLSGMPDGWGWTLQDDNGDIGNATDTTPTWNWVACCTDGGVIGGLENAVWDIQWELMSGAGIDKWYFLSADDGKYDHQLVYGQKGQILTVRSEVPEPASLLLIGAGLLGLGAVQRKRVFQRSW